MTNSNSYLILYLIIILILLYAITFMTGYSCNTQALPLDTFKQKERFNNYYDDDEYEEDEIDDSEYFPNGVPVYPYEDFNQIENFENSSSGTASAPPVSPNDFTLVAVGYANQVYVQDVIGGVWNVNSPAVQNSQSVIDITVMPNGSLIGVGTDNQLYLRQTLNSPWVNMNVVGKWISVSVMNDGKTLLLTGQDSHPYTYDITNPSQQAQQVSQDGGICKVIQLQDSSYLLVGGGGCDTLYITSNLANGWQMASTSDIGIISIAQTPSGQILGLKRDGTIYTKGADYNTWNKTQTCCFSAIAVMPIPPQKIMGYERMGAFIDDSSRTIPNLVGNFNTLQDCINASLSQGYNTVGYQYMNYCFAGNNSPYDRNGFQTDNTKSITAYPGVSTNIVYKTSQELVTTQDPAQGEVFVYEKCQFGGSGSKMTTGEYPDFGDELPILSVKVGINTNVTLYQLPNYQGTSMTIFGYSDIVNKTPSCIQDNNTFSSAKVVLINNAMPYNSADLTNAQLTSLWTGVGCNAESSLITNKNQLSWWKNTLKTTAEVQADMKAYATDNDPVHKQFCYMPSGSEDSPAEGEVVLFEDCDYSGRYKKFGLGDVTDVGSDFNDITSSLSIGPYTSVTIYEQSNYGGKSITFKNDSAGISGISCLIANNFNDMLSSLKISPAFQPVNNSLDLHSDDVTVLGPYNMSPWNATNFADKTAQWIWNTQGAQSNAPINSKPVRFQLLIPVSNKLDIPVVIHVIAVNAPQNANTVKVNNKIVGQIMDAGWLTPNYTQIETALAPGNNLLEFDVQNTSSAAGLLVSVINSNTNAVVANSGSGKWGWVDPNKVVSSIMAEELPPDFVIHDEAAVGKIVKIKDLKEIPQLTVGGTFRLVVELKDVPPYIKGQQFNKGDINNFYLSVEKLDPNCSVFEENNCLNVYADNKKCKNNALTNVTKKNAFRLVLVSKDYVLDPQIPFGKNVDFTMVKIGEKYYLKNLQTGFMPKLFTNDFKQEVYGYMDTGYLSNYNSLNKNLNKTCDKKPVTENKNKLNTVTESEFVNCSTNGDGSMYLMTTSNLLESNPLRFVLNKDGSVSISLQTFNFYGSIDKSYSLIFCNFNVDTYSYIEKLTNPLGTFLINLVCFDLDNKRRLPNNTLNFKFEISKYPVAYLKDENIYNLNN